MATFYLHINERELDLIAVSMAATKKQVNAASRRALSKLTRWVKSVSMRELARDTGLPRKVFKRRLMMSVRGNQQTARVWYGLYAIPLSDLSPRQTRTGVTAGPIERRHAFIVEQGGRKQVYRRVSADERLPIGVQYRKSIKHEVRNILISDINPRIRAMFARYFEQELRWEQRRAGA